VNDPLNPTNGLDPIGNPLHDSLSPGTGLPQDPTDPLNALGLPGAVPDPLSLGDPMLDALEQSIQNPPGFVDPLIEQDGLFMDDVARRLDQVEANIENASPVPLLPGDQAGGVPIIEDEELPATQLSPAEDGARLPEAEEADELQNIPPQNSQRTVTPRPGSSRKPPFTLRSGDGGHGGHREPFPRTTFAGGRLTKARGGGSARACPDTNESVNKEYCQCCEKYRHWPDGTDEEPKECWHDWMAAPKFDKRGDRVDEEEE